MGGFEDFDRYCAENNVQPDDYGEAFARCIAEQTGGPVPGFSLRVAGNPER